jgi:hypothetical protein
MTPELREACRRALHVLTRDGRTLAGGDALPIIVGALGWHRTARVTARPPLIWLLRPGYALVARFRGPLSRLLDKAG